MLAAPDQLVGRLVKCEEFAACGVGPDAESASVLPGDDGSNRVIDDRHRRPAGELAVAAQAAPAVDAHDFRLELRRCGVPGSRAEADAELVAEGALRLQQ